MTTGTTLVAYHDDENGRTVAFYTFRERVCVMAADLGRLYGYGDEGRGLGDLVTKDWSAEFVTGRDFAVLKGDDLRDFKAIAALRVPGTLSGNARACLILYESGVDLVTQKTEKPEGVRLRRWLADNVLPKLRRGEAVDPADAPVFASAPSTALAVPPPPDRGLDIAALQAFALSLVPVVAAAMAQALGPLHDRLDRIDDRLSDAAKTSGLLTTQQVSIVWEQVREIAELWVALRWADTLRNAAKGILRDLYSILDMRVGERRVHLIPSTSYGAVLGRLHFQRRHAREVQERQRGRPRVAPIRPTDPGPEKGGAP